MLVAGYDARWEGIVLDCNAGPEYGSTRQGGMSPQERLDSSFTHHLDTGQEEATPR